MMDRGAASPALAPIDRHMTARKIRTHRRASVARETALPDHELFPMRFQIRISGKQRASNVKLSH